MFYVDDEMIFSDYIFIWSELKRAIDFLRDEYAQEKYSTEYNMLDSENQQFIRTKYPIRVLEIYDN